VSKLFLSLKLQDKTLGIVNKEGGIMIPDTNALTVSVSE
jgi:hypothetical protein